MVPSVYLASSVCRSLQCLISALTQGGEGDLLFRLTCLIVLWRGRNTANKYYWQVLAVSATLGLPLFTAFMLPQSTLFRLQVALQGAGPGLHALPRSKPLRLDSRVLHKGADSVGPAFYAFPRLEQLRRPGAW